MRKIFKSISAIAIITAFASTFSVADAICYDLCMSCRNAERAENCNKIETTCNCPFVIDSAKSKNMGIEISKRKLIDDLIAGCDKSVCARTVTFQDGPHNTIEKCTQHAAQRHQGGKCDRRLAHAPQELLAYRANVHGMHRALR